MPKREVSIESISIADLNRMSFKGASERMFSKFEIANKKSGVDD
jgi:hypothetical protein